MFKQKSILDILLSVLILSTSLGAVMYKHYCGDVLQEVAFAEKDKHCTHHAKDKEMPPCHKHETDKADCCKTETQKVSVDDAQQQKESNSILKTGSSFVSVIYVLVNYLFSNPLESQAQSTIQIFDSPPLYKAPLQVLYQSFLI
ncbi:hypothetical protein SAMN05661096_01862 [Marivirga sericea]|uniref:Uncharacterized protein n=1 Tax=Marivirga sericea TaxID=1028 RepID=A0A1X7JNF1_9BACT|nr:hypothetical protein [Marivirga sericea]SMG29524.1 hypothetical protein SAMN05661096_01862 [Marivirga sericea]